MALTISQDDLTEKNGEAIALTLKAGNNTAIEIRPEYQLDKWNKVSASIGARTDNRNIRFDNLFFAHDDKGNSSRVKGASKYGAGSSVIDDAAQIAKIAGNFGLDAAVVHSISYSSAADRINDVSVTFKPGTSIEDLNRNNLGFVLALEKEGIVPSGTTFEASEKEALANGFITVNVGGAQGRDVLRSIDFGAEHNSTGQPFTVRQLESGRIEITFGKPQVVEHGSLYKAITGADFKAAEKIASVRGAELHGEQGVTGMGVWINADESVCHVIDRLASKGVISRVLTAAAFREWLDANKVAVEAPSRGRRPQDPAFSGLNA